MRRPLRYPLTVFYDASCRLCANEMHALKKLDAQERLALVDCSSADFDDGFLIGDGLTRNDLMARRHARDATGQWYVALDAFEAIYRAAGLERAARVWGDPRWRPLLGRLYPWIARYRQALSRLGLSAIVRRAIPKPCGVSSAPASPRAGSCRSR